MRATSLMPIMASAFALVLSASPALSADISAQTAAELKKALETAISSYAGPDVTMSLGGNIEVTPAGDHYNFTVPDIRLTDTESRTETLILYKTQGTFKPTNQDKQYSFTLSLPSPVAQMVDATGTPLSIATVGSHKINGIWAQELQTLPALTVNLSEIKWAPIDPTASLNNRTSITASTLDAVMTNTPTTAAATHYDGNFSFTLSKLSVVDNLDGELLALGKLGLESKYKNSALAPDDTTTDPMAMLLQQTANMTDGQSDLSFTLADLKLTMGGLLQSNKQTWQLAQAQLVSTSDFKDGKMSGTLKLSHNGLLSQTSNAAVAEVIPASGMLDFAFTDVPVQTYAKTLLEQKATPAGSNDNATLLRKAMGDHPHKITLNGFNLQAQTMSLSARGSMSNQKDTPFGMAGDLTAQFTGLDETVGKLALISRADNNAPGGGNSLAQFATMMLSIAQLSGQAEPVAAGTLSKRNYNFALASDGIVTMDGEPIANLMQPAAPATSAPALVDGTVSPALPAPAAQ